MEQLETPAAAGRADVDQDLRQLDVIVAQLDGVESALRRIDAGDYGRCGTCGSTLPDVLLDADPLADACAAHRRQG